MSEVTVRSVETVIVDLPLVRRQRFAAMSTSTQSVVIVRIMTEEGVEGIGEACTPSGPWWGGESVETIKTIIDGHLAPILIGADPFSLSELAARMNRAVYGNSFAKAGLECALLDLQGRVAGMPVYDLLGGSRRKALRCCWPLATGNADQEIEEAEHMLGERKFDAFKLKLGLQDADDDVARACRIARALEGKADVRVDPNESWDEVTSRRLLPVMADAGIEVIEQPMPRDNLEGSARLTAASTAAIMLDESVRTPGDMMRATALHAGDVVSLKVMKSGGMKATKMVADIAEVGGVSVYVGTFLEPSLGAAASLHLAAILPSLPFGGELCGTALIAEDVVTKPLRHVDFELRVPAGPGLGVTLDEDKLAAFRRDRTVSSHPVLQSGAAE